jgi:translocator protein
MLGDIMNLIKLVLSILICESAGLIGSIFTNMSLNTWYFDLNKPSFQPPDIVFPIVWNILFILMAISLYLIWIDPNENKKINTNVAILFFVLQLILNISWSLVFFGMRSPIFGLIFLLTLWMFILLTILNFYKINKIAAYLMLPYILWVTFAGVLNAYIIYLNP